MLEKILENPDVINSITELSSVAKTLESILFELKRQNTMKAIELSSQGLYVLDVKRNSENQMSDIVYQPNPMLEKIIAFYISEVFNSEEFDAFISDLEELKNGRTTEVKEQ